MLVYKLINTVNGKIYVGKFIGENVQERWRRHVSCARKGLGFHLHRAIIKYGPKVFTLEVLERGITSKAFLSEREKYFIALFNSNHLDTGYNKTSGGDGGYSPVGEEKEEWRKKCIPGFKGHRHTEETRRKMSEGAKHRMQSPEYRKKMSDAQKGRKGASIETRKKMSESHRWENLSEETKRKLCEARKGERNPNYGKAPWLGKHHLEETKQKLALANTGREFSQEHIANMRKAQTLRQERKREELFAPLFDVQLVNT
jgi:group I intron endonuclease